MVTTKQNLSKYHWMKACSHDGIKSGSPCKLNTLCRLFVPLPEA